MQQQELFLWEGCKLFFPPTFCCPKIRGEGFLWWQPGRVGVNFCSEPTSVKACVVIPLDLLSPISLIPNPDIQCHAKFWWPLVPLSVLEIVLINNIVRIIQNCFISLLSEVYQERGKLLYSWRDVWNVGKFTVWFSFWNLPNFLKHGGNWTNQILVIISTFLGQICVTEEIKS